MTRRDYLLITRIFRSAYLNTKLAAEIGSDAEMTTHLAVIELAEEFALSLAEDNPRFNALHFLNTVSGITSLELRAVEPHTSTHP